MNTKNTHCCTICGLSYANCDLCESSLQYTPWRSLCDTQRHYQIFLIISSLRGKVMNEDEVKEALEKLKVTEDEIKTFIPAVQEILLPIMEETVVETVVENETVEEVTKTKSKRK